jgi:hypothetical protein
MATAEELLTEMAATAQEQLRWTRAAAVADVKRTIEETLTTTTQRKCYEALDGTRSGSEAAQASGASNASVSGWARRWRELGIAYEYAPESGRARTKHLVSLEDLGVPVEVDGAGS